MNADFLFDFLKIFLLIRIYLIYDIFKNETLKIFSSSSQQEWNFWMLVYDRLTHLIWVSFTFLVLLYILSTVHGFLILYVNLCKSYYDQVKVEKF